ncbi:DUF6268 family outer membrane beta-barrel protein [Pendulispora albinea]|uniref:DUF6268 family outer membrane beta-barrel protein n=1 Tax=Pendulispora albinea TaxID=2741071 RepID=A0ABZ2LPJ9_9BACT
MATATGMRKVLAVAGAAGVLAAGSPAAAQKIDLVSVSAQYLPSADMKSAPGKAQVSSYDVSFMVPVPLGEKSFLFPGAGYHVDSVSFSDTRPDFVDLRAFHAVEISALFVQLLPSDWALSLRAAPGLAGDFGTVDGRMVRANAMAMASHTFSPRFVLGGGAILSYSFGTLLPLPAVYASYRPFEGFEVEGFLPAFLRVHHTIGDRVRLGIAAEFQGNEYAVRDDRIRGRWPCTAARADDPATSPNEAIARPSECFDNLAYSVGIAGFTAGVRLVSTVWLTGLFGHSFYRRFDQRNEERNEIPDGSQDIPNVLVVRAGLLWRMPTRE